jgi:hypothetical protein
VPHIAYVVFFGARGAAIDTFAANQVAGRRPQLLGYL